MLGMRHVALFVHDLEACLKFYRDVVGMQQEWMPDPDNVYLTSACADNVALHRLDAATKLDGAQRLDHIGFILKTPQDVDQWCDYLVAHGTKVAQATRTHRDGARSFYCFDPAGNLVQFIYHSPISDKHAA
ncbi:MAG: glyoxalase [Betaproteobacteria bacterium HGW-Betaproteobacteria-1]|nr:MAG: glyoxalase [Betaproteobacteria bacterium HGW-Betaproteobacteria-1]